MLATVRVLYFLRDPPNPSHHPTYHIFPGGHMYTAVTYFDAFYVDFASPKQVIAHLSHVRIVDSDVSVRCRA
jgi:hypothetical protein